MGLGESPREREIEPLGYVARSISIQLSIIVNCYNMRREALRTLYRLSADYQREVSVLEYEVLVIDNG